jgi:hypothetical protein
VSDRVVFHIGPADSAMAEAWLANSHRLVVAVKESRQPLSIDVNDVMLELCETLLDVWSAHAAAGPTFDWSMETDVDQVTHVVKQWLEIGQLTDDELAGLGCAWAPDWTRPFADAVVAGAIQALPQCGERGAALLARLEGR